MSDKLLQFKSKIQSIYPDLYSTVIEVIEAPLVQGFRINLTKISEESALKQLKEQSFKVIEGPIKNSFFIENINALNLRLSDTQLFNNGSIYIQNFSSMLPATVLNTQKGDNVADLCASPGSKTTQIATLINGEAQIYAYDNNANRLQILRSNLMLQGFDNIQVIRANAALLYKNPANVGYFDKVLADVPCSNEGLIRPLNTTNLTRWNSKHSKMLSQLQKKILFSGLQLLKRGGTLVYSTCTYSPRENEAVVDWALKLFSDIELMQVVVPGHFDNMLPGFTSWEGKNLSPELSKCARVLPTNLFSAFFLAKFIKR